MRRQIVSLQLINMRENIMGKVDSHGDLLFYVLILPLFVHRLAVSCM